MKRPIRERMQEIGSEINDRIPQGFGFFTLIAPTESIKDGDFKVDYISNLHREDVVNLMREWIQKIEKENFGKHL